MANNTRLPRDEVLWKIFRSIRSSSDGCYSSKSSARDRVISLLADEYGIDHSKINQRDEQTLYTVQSKLVRLLFPVSARAQSNLSKAIDSGISFKHALLIARGRYDTREQILAEQPSQTPVVSIRGIPLPDLFASVISTARANGYDADDIQTAFSDAFDAYDAENV